MIFHFCTTNRPVYRRNYDAIFRKNEADHEQLTEPKPKRVKRYRLKKVSRRPPGMRINERCAV